MDKTSQIRDIQHYLDKYGMSLRDLSEEIKRCGGPPSSVPTISRTLRDGERANISTSFLSCLINIFDCEVSDVLTVSIGKNVRRVITSTPDLPQWTEFICEVLCLQFNIDSKIISYKIDGNDRRRCMLNGPESFLSKAERLFLFLFKEADKCWSSQPIRKPSAQCKMSYMAGLTYGIVASLDLQPSDSEILRIHKESQIRQEYFEAGIKDSEKILIPDNML